MRRSILAAILVTCAAHGVVAQTDRQLSPLAVAVACAPPPSFDPTPSDALRIIGSQDSVRRELYGDRELLVIGGGTAAGVQLGQQFFLRREVQFGIPRGGRGSRTTGWIRVVAVNASTAIASIDHACGGIEAGDYLDPFVEPVVSAEMERTETRGEPDFSNLGRIVGFNEDRMIVSAGDFALIDWGQAQGLTPGTRFAVYRDVGTYRDLGGKGLPLASVGEGVVISTSHTVALARLTRVRDAVYAGDYIAIRK